MGTAFDPHFGISEEEFKKMWNKKYEDSLAAKQATVTTTSGVGSALGAPYITTGSASSWTYSTISKAALGVMSPGKIIAYNDYGDYGCTVKKSPRQVDSGELLASIVGLQHRIAYLKEGK